MLESAALPTPPLATMPSNRQRAEPVTPLVIRFGRLGDMLLQEPLLHLLRCRYGAPVKILTRGTWTSALYRGHPDVGETWELRQRNRMLAFSPERWAAIAKLRAHDGPIYISEDTRGSLKRMAWLLRLARVPRTQCTFLRDMDLREDEHWVDQALRFGRTTPSAFDAAAYPMREDEVRTAPRLYLDANDRADADSWLRRRGCTDAPLVLIQPGNWRMHRWWHKRADDPKFWPVANWTALLRTMHETLPTANLVLCGTPVETAVCEAIARETGLAQVKLATNDLPIRRLLAVLERAHSMVSIDTGPAHLAAAMGCPLVVLYAGKYGPEKWDRRSPFGKPVINVGAAPLVPKVSDIAPEQAIVAWRKLMV